MKKHLRIVEEKNNGQRIDLYVSQVFEGISRREARRTIASGSIWVNGRVTRMLSRRLRRGDRVSWRHLSKLESSSENVGDDSFGIYGGQPHFLYRDNWMAILDKPSGIPVEPTPKEDLRICLRQIEALLRSEGGHPSKIYATAVHRLDAAASGAVAFATKKLAARELSAQFAQRKAKRIYLALVAGTIREDHGIWRSHMDRVGPGLRRGVVDSSRGKLAVTQFQVLERFSHATLVQVSLETGRTHQIRVHFSHMGHPLIGDWLYCDKEIASRYPSAPRLFLHASSLSLQHPQTCEMQTFQSPLSDEWMRYVSELKET